MLRNPEHEHSWSRERYNTAWLDFKCDITAPSSGAVTIKELLAGGAFGSDLSSSFAFSVVNDGDGNPRRLKIVDNDASLTHRKWYGIRNASWAGVESFEVDYVVQMGDADDNLVVNAADLTKINSWIPTAPPVPELRIRGDITGTFGIGANDLSAANAYIPSTAVTKPSGH